MTVETEVSKFQYTGNSSARDFSFDPMPIIQNDHLVVIKTTLADGAETTLTEGTGASNYSVTVAEYPGTGYITFPADGSTPLANTHMLTIKREVPLLQETELSPGRYIPKTQERTFDYLMMVCQQLKEEINRCVKVEETTTTDAPTAQQLLDDLTAAIQAAEDVISSGAVPANRTLTASTGLTGGGDLSANRSFAIASTGVTPGTYTHMTATVNARGQITSASNGAAATGSSVAWINVKDFGATGDGTTDDTAAIETAIASVTSGGTLYFPFGTYRVTNSITLPPQAGDAAQMIVRGDGWGSVIKPMANSMTQVFNVTGDQITIQDLSFENTSSLATYGVKFAFANGDDASKIVNCRFIAFTVGLYAYRSSGWEVSQCFFLNQTGWAVVVFGEGYNSTINRNYVLGSSGVQLAFTYGSMSQPEGIRIIDNTILCSASSTTGIQIQGGLEIEVANNIVGEYDDYGIFVDGSVANKGVSFVSIAGTYCGARSAAASTSTGIKVTGTNASARDIRITACTLVSNKWAGIALDDVNVQDVAIRDCSFYANTAYAGSGGGADLYVVGTHRGRVSGCRFGSINYPGTSYSLRETGDTSYLFVSDCTFECDPGDPTSRHKAHRSVNSHYWRNFGLDVPFFEGATPSTFKGALAYKSSNTAYTSGAGFGSVAFDTLVFDTYAGAAAPIFATGAASTPIWATGANTKLTVPKGAKYVRLTASLDWENSGGGLRAVTFKKNGSYSFVGREGMVTDPANGGSSSLQIKTPVLAVSAGDYFEVFAAQQSGGSLNVLGANSDGGYMTWFQMEVLG